jgi:YD repeat-containing protein
MDDLGNRTGSETQRNTAHTYAVDSLTNRYTAIDAAPIAHDTAGNLTRDRQNYRYEYDYENRIARIYKLSGETQVTVATFDYDALGHRVRKIDAVAGTTTLYYNDPEWRVLAEKPDWNTV